MFGDKLAAAQKQIASLTALIASTGFKLEAGVEPTADAFQAHLATQNKSAVDAALAPVNAQVAAVIATSAAYRAGLDAAGIKLGDFKAEDTAIPSGKTVADTPLAQSVKTACETAISARAAKQIAASGHPHAIAVPAAEGAGEAKTAAELRAEFSAITDAGERAAFYAKHKATLLS